MGEAVNIIERDKLYKLRDGRIVRVICVDAPGKCPIICLTKSGWSIIWQTPGGFHLSSGEPHPADIVSEHREPREWWIHPKSYCVREVIPMKQTLREEGYIRVREILEDEEKAT